MKSTMARIQNGAGVQLPECCSCHWQVRHPGLMAGEAELAKLKARFKSEFHKLQHMQQFVCPFCTISRWKTLNQSVKKKRLRELIELQRTYPVGQVFVHPGTHWYPPLRPPKSGLWTPDAPEKSQDSLEPKVEHLSREEPSSTPLRPELKLVTDWSRESPPPEMSASIRRRLLNVALLDTSMLRDIMLPKHGATLSQSFCNFGNFGFMEGPRTGVLGTVQVQLRVDYENNEKSSYWLTGIVNTSVSKKASAPVFSHKPTSGKGKHSFPVLLQSSYDIEVVLHSTPGFSGICHSWLFLSICRVDCTAVGVQQTNFVVGALCAAHFDESRVEKSKEGSEPKAEKTKLNYRACEYVPLSLRSIFSHSPTSLDDMICHENNAHFPFRASRLVFLKTNLAKCYNQLLGMNSRDIGNELVWPNKDWADSALSPETRRYSLYDELLLAGPQAHKFARQKQDVITRHHYLRHWWVLLNIEENRHVGDLKSLDVHNTSFRMNTRYPGEKVRVAVNIPGVDEKRPNLTYGMAINLRVTKNDNGKSSTFEMMGYVADRRGTNVQIDLSSRSMMECAAATGAASLEAFLTQTIFHLRFTHQKDYFQAMRLALLFLHTDHRTLFPTRNSLKRSANKRPNAIVDAVVNKLTDSAAWVDNQVNGEQRVAVGTILSGECGFAPIVIHGPPGTGKTKTVVEAVNQIVRADFALNAYAHRKILLTAPSDIACDIICSRLSASLGTNEMHRMNLPQRKVNEVVEMAILPYCNLGQTGEFQLSDIDSLKSYRVIVCTCAASALLLGYLPESAEPWGSSELSDQPLSRISIANHFQYIFIDEAGQALEPEVLIPITVGRIGGSNATVVMSGDPNQLEASVRSPVANSFGFGTSCMERLMKLPLYSPSAGKSTSPFVFVRLMENYRSHVDILKFSARVFYEDRMVARCELSKANQFLNWGPIPRKASGQPFPLVLHSVEGSEVLDMGSTSLYNFEEANAVVEIIEGLLAATEIKCNTGMISVLAAYWQQVRLIRKQLRKKELGNVRVGVVDDYQGQEAPITILSCVLTHPQQQISENVSPLTGLLGCPKRTNVALTRAMGLSIVVASPEFLRNDVYFARLAKYCLLNNALIGKSPFSPDSANGAEDMKSSESPEDSNLLTAWNFMEHYATMSLKSMRLFSESNTSGADVTSVDAFYKEDTPFFGNSL